MPHNYYVGQRVSFDSALCTIRYIGPVEATSKEWIGVEWDNVTRGKHNGLHQGIRYFECISDSPNAGSFLRLTRAPDPAQSFVEAVRQKYGSDVTLQPLPASLNQQIKISGKVVEEVGFEKIRQQLAQLKQLQIVLVDGFRVCCAETPDLRIREVCPSIAELDLSRNLFEVCKEIVSICGELRRLRTLRLNGNRIKVVLEDLEHAEKACTGIRELELDDMLLPWKELCLLAQQFVSLEALTASANGFRMLSTPLHTPNLTSLTLEYNNFSSLTDLSPLAHLGSLEELYLKGNKIASCRCDSSERLPIFNHALHYVDVSYNSASTWSFVDELPVCFPGLNALRFSKNPIYEAVSKETGSISHLEEAFMLTVARIASLTALNFSTISPAERMNAEIFYLSRIGKAMAEVPESEEHSILSQHKRFRELCELHGAPIVARKLEKAIDPDFLEARLIKFTFHLPANSEREQEQTIEMCREIPKGFDIYRVKGIAGRMLGLNPRKIRLIWETGDWDPVAGYEDEVSESGDEEEQKDIEELFDENMDTIRRKGKWVKREVEIEDSTRRVGFCVDGNEVRVRVELR